MPSAFLYQNKLIGISSCRIFSVFTQRTTVDAHHPGQRGSGVPQVYCIMSNQGLFYFSQYQLIQVGSHPDHSVGAK